MNETTLLTALLLMSVLQGSAPQPAKVEQLGNVAVADGETVITGNERTGRLYDYRNKMREAQKENSVVLVILGHGPGTGPVADARARARAATVKRWMQTVGDANDVRIDVRPAPAPRDSRRIATLALEIRPKSQSPQGQSSQGQAPQAAAEARRVVMEIPFVANNAALRTTDQTEKLFEALEDIRNDVQRYGTARLVIEGLAARGESTAMAQNRIDIVKPWFDGRQKIGNIEVVPRPVGNADKSAVRLVLERGQ